MRTIAPSSRGFGPGSHCSGSVHRLVAFMVQPDQTGYRTSTAPSEGDRPVWRHDRRGRLSPACARLAARTGRRAQRLAVHDHRDRVRGSSFSARTSLRPVSQLRDPAFALISQFHSPICPPARIRLDPPGQRREPEESPHRGRVSFWALLGMCSLAS